MVAARDLQSASDPLSVELCGIPLRTPLLPAAGTLAKEALAQAANAYGAILPKTVTPRPRPGNPPPRLAEAPAGMVNSIGLQNRGLDRFLRELDDYDVGLPLFVSVAADTAADFAAVCRRLAGDGRISAVELNLSCPNVEHGGAQFCASPGAVEGAVAAAGRELEGAGKPLIVKLANDGVVQNAVAAEGAGADAITAINTVPALILDARARRVFLKGGLSGPAIKPIALRAVYEVSRAVGVPVVGCGGVAGGEDVAEFMLAGASAVQVGSGSFVRGPDEILAEFEAYLREESLSAGELPTILRQQS